MDPRKAALSANISEHRSKLDRTLLHLDERLAEVSAVPAQIVVAATAGRNLARLLGAATVISAVYFVLSDLVRSLRSRR